MADLDSRSKRAASVQLLKPYALDLPLPDGTIDAADRQHAAWDYSGIAASVDLGGGLMMFHHHHTSG